MKGFKTFIHEECKYDTRYRDSKNLDEFFVVTGLKEVLKRLYKQDKKRK